MLSIIATSNGITFFLHHCSCRHKLEISVFEKIICEDDHHHDEISHNCCEEDAGLVRIDSETESCGCQNESVKFKLVDANFSSQANSSDFQQIVAVNIPFGISIADQEEIICGYIYESPPPLVWGRKLVTFFHCSKTPEHIS